MRPSYKITEACPTPGSDDEKDILWLQEETLPGVQVWPIWGTYWFIARDADDEPVAYAGLHVMEHDAGIGMLCRAGVVQAARGDGLQVRLIKAREKKAIALGLTRLITNTAADNVHSANNMIRCGYHLYSPPKGWGYPDFIYWEKSLWS